MSVSEKIQADLKTAMREQDAIARDALRMALAALKNRRIELGKDLSEQEILAVLSKQVKTRQESYEQYEKAGRQDLADKEGTEIEVLRRYLPAELSEGEIREIVEEKIAELGISSKKELGQLMKAVLSEHKGRVNGKLVQRFASELLG